MPTRTKGYLNTSIKTNALTLKPKVEKDFRYAMAWWKRYSYNLRAITPKCAICGIITKPINKVVDHVIPVRFGGSFEDKRNHQVICTVCHNSKTAKEKTKPLAEYKQNEKGELIPKQS